MAEKKDLDALDTAVVTLMGVVSFLLTDLTNSGVVERDRFKRALEALEEVLSKEFPDQAVHKKMIAGFVSAIRDREAEGG